MNCTLCHTPLVNQIADAYYHCTTCHAIVKDVATYLNPEEELMRYQSHKNEVTDERYQKFTSPITNAILANFSSNHLGLDYGCGPGPVITFMLEKSNYKVVKYDPFFFPNETYLSNQYDYIFSCEVFEHFYNPEKELQKLLGLLKPNGHLLVMTKFFLFDQAFGNWYYRKDPTHVFIYTKETTTYIAEHYQLSILHWDEQMVIFKKRGTE